MAEDDIYGSKRIYETYVQNVKELVHKPRADEKRKIIVMLHL